VIKAGPEAETAHNLSYWKAISDGQVISLGIHRDLLAKTAGKWRVRHRVIEHTWTKAGGYVGR
jgi:hypothetical protein